MQAVEPPRHRPSVCPADHHALPKRQTWKVVMAYQADGGRLRAIERLHQNGGGPPRRGAPAALRPSPRALQVRLGSH